MLAAAPAPGLVQVMLDPLRGRRRDLYLLERPGHARVLRRAQVRAAPARATRVVIDDLVWLGPAQRRSRRPGLPARLALRTLRRPALLPGRPAAGQDIV
jgi:hypothetical protein